MNLGNLIDFVGNLLDYDPTNDTYREQLVSLLNDAQTRCLTDRPWDFATRDRKLNVYTDASVSVGVTNGSGLVTGGPFPVSTTNVRPGSSYELGILRVTDSASVTADYRVMYVSTGNQLFLDRDFTGVTGAYTATLFRREVYLPSDCAQVQNVADPAVGVPAKLLALSKWEREDANLDPAQLGTLEAYLPSEGLRVQAPTTPRGVQVVAAAPGQGIRTIKLYMVNVLGPASPPFPVYPRDVSDGFESAFSKPETYTLSDTETLRMTPETIPNKTGFYRRYYFTCPEANILAPVRVRDALINNLTVTGVDTVPPPGGITLAPNLALSHLSGQSFQATSIRYQFDQSAVYQSVQLYPHPSEDQELDCRMVISPSRMLEDQDAPLIPAAYAQLIAYAALESLTLKVDNAALSQVYARKKDVLYKGMEQTYLKVVPRRLVKGEPTSGFRFGSNPFGPLRLIP
ncbi:hypothetical protein EBT31_10930 [bacterium]|jgi:hypothetical protein|nr:hypothetical protein [bacterium]